MQLRVARMQLRVLSWNLAHGRSVPPSGRDLTAEFAAALTGWEWDVALLQEVPPWWPPQLARAARATERTVLTSRNQLLALRRAIATRWPDLIKSNGGGANAILVRGQAIAEHRTLRLCWWPERRRLQAVKLAGGPWIGNLHATVHDEAAAQREARIAEAQMLAFSRGRAVVLGGDFNVRRFDFDTLRHAGGEDVDHVFVAGLEPVGETEVLERGALSDHAPVVVTVATDGDPRPSA
jgi:endonuclease/exonuclease/phosphatase family metal-dependent hydrolase